MNAGHDNRTSPARPDAWTRFCLTSIAVLLAVVAAGLWAPVELTSTATAAPQRGQAVPLLPDTSAQFNEMIEQLRLTNAKLDRIQQTLTGGEVKVVVVEADNKAEGKRDVPVRKN